jgi:hypothetical protein
MIPVPTPATKEFPVPAPAIHATIPLTANQTCILSQRE